MEIRIISSGAKNRAPADQAIDCRHLPNPHTIPGLRPRDGRQKPVSEWVLGHPETQTLIADALARIPDDRTHWTIATFCNAGRHRAPALAEALAERLNTEHTVTVEHRNLKPPKQRTTNTNARGYGWKHQQERDRWKTRIATGTITCWRCIARGIPHNQALISPAEPWDLGHDDNDRTRYRGPEHRKCNRGEPSRRKTRPQPHSRRW